MSGMRQLALGISPPPEPSLENFVPGQNVELLARLGDLREGRLAESILYIWGEPGSGRSHLLQACAGAGVAVADDVDSLDEHAQIDLFNRINAAREAGTAVLAAGSAPPAQLRLREDLRSRLAWGLVYHLKPLTDAERALYLTAEAERRGMRLSDDIAAYLLARVRRDLASLGSILDALDRASLEQKRHLTLPLVRDVLKALDE
ncbi:MAG TPA: DnaA/Hda family protein [Burkholderiales bacterium]|nr:DnaA/Hda family protein [Burkholderiales bacterium]